MWERPSPRSRGSHGAQDMDESSGVKRLAGVRAVFSAPSPPRAARSASTDTQPLLPPGAATSSSAAGAPPPRSDSANAVRHAAAAKAARQVRVAPPGIAQTKSPGRCRSASSDPDDTAEAQDPTAAEKRMRPLAAQVAPNPQASSTSSRSSGDFSHRHSLGEREKHTQFLKHASSFYPALQSTEDEARKRSWALKKLTDSVRALIYRRMAACHPLTFRVNNPERPDGVPAGLAEYGQLVFSGAAQNSPAHFMHLADARAPYKTTKRFASDTLDMMEKHWGMSPASVLISITGGAQDFVLPPRLNKAFKHGLAKAAQATNAWVFTGGTDSGVMQLVGQALAEYSASVQCIGIVTHGVVLGREALRGCRDEEIPARNPLEIARTKENSRDGANLEPNHTHFLLVDNGKEGGAAWGGEIAFRAELEKEHCLRRKVPRVLLVVQGGPGTLATILEAIKGDSPVVLVKDSGGVASLLDHFLNTYKDEGSVHYRKGEILPQFEKAFAARRDQLATIAELDSLQHKVSSFGLTENSTAELDLHLLNAVINDSSQVTPEGRLRLAVEWNRKDVVERVMRGATDMSGSDMRSALQCAIENRRVQIIKVLIAPNPSLVKKLDFLALYRTEHRVFLDSAKLWQGLVSDEAMRSDGKPTTVRTYAACLLPFLEPLIPGLHERLSRGLKFLSFSDLLFWAVVIGDLHLAECFWQQYMRRGDPVRMALLAAQTSLNVAKVSQTETAKYVHNATVFEQWACDVLDKCHSRQDAMLVLMRPSDHWPGTILRVAIDGQNKNFVGHKFVQMIVDECWRGNTFGSLYALPQSAGFWDILRHTVVPTVEMEPLMDEPQTFLDDKAAALKGGGSGKAASRMTTAGLKRGGTKTHQRNGSQRRASILSHRSPSFKGGAPPDPGQGVLGGGRGSNPLTRGCRSLSYCLVRLVRPHHEEGFRHFFKVPRVKFTLKFTSYLAFLLVYACMLAQRGEFEMEDAETGLLVRAVGGPHHGFSALDGLFFAWSTALWLEEMHQWALDLVRGHSHMEDFSNVIDVVSLSTLLLVLVLRLVALCSCAGFEQHVLSDALDRRQLRGFEGEYAGSVLHPSGGGGGGGGGGFGGDAMVEPPTQGEIWEATYHGCHALATSQLLLSINAIPCFARLCYYLTIWKPLGILTVILTSLAGEIGIWLLFFAIAAGGFCSAMLGLMPSLGAGAWSPIGSFFLPFWAMYGEFGELGDLSSSGGAMGTFILWSWSFVAQVLLINILIAMMTETYETVKRNADNEWRYSRVFVVDEFAGSVYDVPSPFSMPFLLYEFGAYFKARLRATAAWRRCRRLCRCGRDQYDDDGDDDDDDGGSDYGGDSRRASSSSRLSSRLSAISAMAFERSADLLTSSLKEEELAEMSQVYPDLIMLADLLEEQESLKKGDLLNQISHQQEALDKVLAKELENQEIILHIDKLHTAQMHMEQLRKTDSAAYDVGGPGGEGAGELKAQLKESRRETQTVRDEGGRAQAELQRALEAERREKAEQLMQQRLVAEMGKTKLAEAQQRLAALEAALESEKGAAARTHTELLVLRAARRTAERHVKARAAHPAYPPRAHVPDEKVSWRARWPDYTPTPFTHAAVTSNNRLLKPGGWADPPDVRQLRDEWARRVSHESNWYFDADGRPLNPRGRTGMCEQGLLGKWGANQAADPIVTRLQPKTGTLQMVAIQRKDTGDWAIPGGMVDDGEIVSATVKREFKEEAGALPDEATRAQFEALVDDLFATGQVVYRGYVDDPRNTDNAWMETTAFHFHCNAELGAMLPLHAGDDAAAVRWLDVDPSLPDYSNLYASHKLWVDKIAAGFSHKDDHQ